MEEEILRGLRTLLRIVAAARAGCEGDDIERAVTGLSSTLADWRARAAGFLRRACGEPGAELVEALKEVRRLWRRALDPALPSGSGEAGNKVIQLEEFRAPRALRIWWWAPGRGPRPELCIPRGSAVKACVILGKDKSGARVVIELRWRRPATGGERAVHLCLDPEKDVFGFLPALVTLGDPANQPFWEALAEALEKEREKARRDVEIAAAMLRRLAALLRGLAAAGAARG